MKDIRNFTNTRILLAALVAACIVDTLGLFVWRYTAEPGGPITKWYDQFQSVAYIIDVASIVIGVVLTQMAASFLGGPWNPLAFCMISVAIQMTHDLFFGLIVVPLVPKGKNSIMDLMKEYATMKGAGWVLVVDAIYMIAASLLTMLFAAYPSWIGLLTLLMTIYVTGYILYTRPGDPTSESSDTHRGADGTTL
jgi:uncharacterized protein YacL